uniref:Integrase catalytic domain-containing protein n=1 Tax=Tanacetum cinerariifolium TaxID=118510 RepID=A0A699GR64_TANCI|nr:hypothetical protein [Tanacetum cinerariifolium]
MNGDAPASIASVSGGAEVAIPPKTTEQKIARRNELKAKSTLLLAIPDEYLLKFHGIKDAKTLWEAIKTRFGGNKEFKKMQKTILKQQYENFAASRSKGLDKTYDRMGYDWIYQAKEGPIDFALMAFSSSSSSSSDTERKIMNKDNIEIIAYQLGLESLEARIVVHQKNEAVFEEDIAFLKYDVKVRNNSITELKNQLEESLKEKDDLKLKLEKFKTSFKNLTNLINSQISPKDKTRLGYDSLLNERDLNNKSDVFESAFDSSVNESEEDNNQANDRYKADDSIFKSTISETVTSVHETKTSTSKTSKKSMEKPKSIRPSAPIIKDLESDSDDDCEIRPSIEQNKPSHAKINFVKSDENTRKSVIEQHTYKQAKNLRIRKFVLNNEGKDTGQREVRPVWNNAQRVNHLNFSNNLTHPHPRRNFVPTAVITNSGKVPVNTAKQSSPRAATSTSTARYVNTAATRPTAYDGKQVLPYRLSREVDLLHLEEVLKEFCQMKGIKREFSVARTPQQNRVAKRKNRTLIEAARTMLADLLLPTIFWAEAVNTACYVQNRVVVIKPHNKPPYELLIGRSLNLDFMRPFGCPVTILNTLDHLGKFEGKADEGFCTQSSNDNDADEAPGKRDDGDRINQINFGLCIIYGFIVYRIDIKSAFLYGIIEEEVYVCQPLGFEDLHFPNKVYKVEKSLYDLYQAPRAWYETLSTYLLENRFRRGTIDKTLFIKNDKDDILLVHVYVDDIIFGSTKKSTANTLMEPNKALIKDAKAEDVDVLLYRSMIGSLMYLTASRPDIMFTICACARFQVTPKTSHLYAVKRIFRYLKGQPKLGIWKSTTKGCQFLCKMLISWKCKKQTIVANSTTEAEYVAATSCCGQVLWIQNQMLDYGLNFMNTKIYIDNESTIYIVRNPVFHSKTKHIEIRHYFIRDSYEKRLIQVIKIHTYHNVADLLTKAFNVSRFNFLVASIGLLNL